jgi:hypothetical protein
MNKTPLGFLTAISDLFILWVIYRYALGGWQTAYQLLTEWSIIPLVFLLMEVGLLVYGSDWRMDIPLFLAGVSLGYWGEWWGTTRGVWSYWNGATPPDYLPPLWGIGLLTVYRLSRWSPLKEGKPISGWIKGIAASALTALPALAFLHSWSRLGALPWSSFLDLHFWVGLLVAVALVFYRFDLGQVFSIYLLGTLVGGFYEYMGTSSGEWRYITAEVPPLWIAPLWGYACVAMTSLAGILRRIIRLSST